MDESGQNEGDRPTPHWADSLSADYTPAPAEIPVAESRITSLWQAAVLKVATLIALRLGY